MLFSLSRGSLTSSLTGVSSTGGTTALSSAFSAIVSVGITGVSSAISCAFSIVIGFCACISMLCALRCFWNSFFGNTTKRPSFSPLSSVSRYWTLPLASYPSNLPYTVPVSFVSVYVSPISGSPTKFCTYKSISVITCPYIAMSALLYSASLFTALAIFSSIEGADASCSPALVASSLTVFAMTRRAFSAS